MTEQICHTIFPSPGRHGLLPHPQEDITEITVLLEKLEEIRDGLLLGYISKDKLIEISRYVRETKINTADEKLAELIGEIELRVEVELAKLMK